jgi:chemotaxis protein CheY-P-specific phosphatase CheC/CheY-like chemotaxis protein
MATKILICDDSRMARNQLAHSIPQDWDVELLFAEDGYHCLEIAQEHNPDLIFLDLNMPNMDGYEALEEFISRDLDYEVIVVSGDIQPVAQSRVSSLGAIDFIKKPISREKLTQTLIHHQLYQPEQSSLDGNPKPTSEPHKHSNPPLNLDDQAAFIDACQEIANIAMGRAGDALARFLDVFIKLPVPKVNYIELNELIMTLQFSDANSTVSSVCQGFIGPGMSGEALLIFNDSSFKNIAGLMKYQGEIDDSIELELLMDISNILIGACLQGFADQLDISLSQRHPVVLGQHIQIPQLIAQGRENWKKTLSIEVNYHIEEIAINCDLLLLFTEDCLEALKQRLSYIA